MRWLSRISPLISLSIALLALPAAAQNTTTVTVAHLLAGGVAVPHATICASPADALGNPINVSSAGWGLLLKDNPLCATVTAGALPSGLAVPDSAHTTAAFPIRYNFRIQVTNSNGLATGAPILISAVPNITGSTWSLDSYTPTVSVTVPPTGIVYTSGAPTSCSGPSIIIDQVAAAAYMCVSGVPTTVAIAGTVTHAISADTATTALSANTATNATHATTADSATTAGTATSATTATTATNATHATTADSATTATTATTATNATHATTADSATTATTASALASAPTNCSAGQATPGIDVNGNSQSCFTPSGGSTSPTEIHPNDLSTGTALNLMASWNQTGSPYYAATTGTGSNGGSDNNPSLVGVCVANCGTSGFGTFQSTGDVSWTCDGQTIVGHWVTISSTNAGQCTDPAPTGSPTEPGINGNPEANSVVGLVKVANSGTGTASTITLKSFTGYNHQGAAGQTPGQGFLQSNYGSSYPLPTYWSQAHTTHALVGNAAIQIYDGVNNGYFEINPGLSGLGASGRDVVLDTRSHGFGGNVALRLNAPTYVAPSIDTASGTKTLDVNASTGNYVWVLTGNTTLATPTDDNEGHIITFDIVQAASGGPFTFAWPSNFKNAPAISTTAGAATVSSYFFDGANYLCVGGCPAAGGTPYPGGSGIPVVVSGASWGTTVVAPAGVIVGTTDIQTLTNKTVDGVSPATLALLASSACVPGSFASQTDGATVTWAIASAVCANASLTFTAHSGSRTLNLTGLVNGGSYVLWIKQDSTGGEGLTLGTGCTWKVGGGGSAAITPSTAANALDILAFMYDGANCYLDFNKNFN